MFPNNTVPAAPKISPPTRDPAAVAEGSVSNSVRRSLMVVRGMRERLVAARDQLGAPQTAKANESKPVAGLVEEAQQLVRDLEELHNELFPTFEAVGI